MIFLLGANNLIRNSNICRRVMEIYELYIKKFIQTIFVKEVMGIYKIFQNQNKNRRYIFQF